MSESLESREEVELYEAHQKSNLMPIKNFYLPEKSNSYKEDRKVLRKQEEALVVLNNVCKEGV